MWQFLNVEVTIAGNCRNEGPKEIYEQLSSIGNNSSFLGLEASRAVNNSIFSGTTPPHDV